MECSHRFPSRRDESQISCVRCNAVLFENADGIWRMSSAGALDSKIGNELSHLDELLSAAYTWAHCMDKACPSCTQGLMTAISKAESRMKIEGKDCHCSSCSPDDHSFTHDQVIGGRV